MIGSFLSRALILVLGYAYPAYECYKTVELNKPDIVQLRFWCQYWILVALLAVFERVGDALVSWLPMYGEAKLAFYVYLWSPKTRGTTYVYETFFRPYIAKHETEIDSNLLVMRTRAGDMMVLGWQKAASYCQTRFFDILQYVASQSQATVHPVQHHQPQQPHQAERHKAPPPATAPEPAPEQAQQIVPFTAPAAAHRETHQSQKQMSSAVPTASKPSASQHPQQAARVLPNLMKSQLQELSSVSASLSPPISPANSQSSNSNPSISGPHQSPRIVEDVQVDKAICADTNESNAKPKEPVIDEAIRVTRARLRRRADTSHGAPPASDVGAKGGVSSW